MVINGRRVINFRKKIKEFNELLKTNNPKLVVLIGYYSHYDCEKVFELDTLVVDREDNLRTLRQTIILTSSKNGKITEVRVKDLLKKKV